MASAGQASEIKTTKKPASSRAGPAQRPLTSPNESIHSRLDDFLREPLYAGNRNIMLPDGCSNKATAIKASCERVRTEIDKITDVISGNKT
ncbi:hypothetical protein F5Y06DRAFT_272032 [Hypoxylon sp. FL0890]|nr:hypothetical protein F5Y06DRAFT_272032 [Hypoxylon sp. FL0890]